MVLKLYFNVVLMQQVQEKESFLMQHILRATWSCKWHQQEHLFGATHRLIILVKL